MIEQKKEEADKDVWMESYIRSLDGATMVAVSPNNYVAQAVR